MTQRIDKTYHPEYGGYVFQPKPPEWPDKWAEPYVTEREARAFMDGYNYAQQALALQEGSDADN